MDRCWILVGMMGAGKSSIGRALAESSGREHFDTDALLERKLGRPISQLFSVYGERTFRDHETHLLRSLEPSTSVLSTGGGIVVRDENWIELRRLGVTVYLEASLQTLIERLGRSKKKRPLLDIPDWQQRIASLLEERKALYELADYTVSVDSQDMAAAAARVLRFLEAPR